MRSLPWVTTNNEGQDQPKNPLKRKKPVKSDIPKPEPTEIQTSEIAESSDSDDTTILDPSGDNAFDAMIPGYDNDDAYIMVEHDLLEASKQVTRHIHLEAYQKHVTAPVVEKEIIRPTTGAPQRRPVVEGESDEETDGKGKDVSALGELLRRRPAAMLVAATPIKRKEKSPVRERGDRKQVQTADDHQSMQPGKGTRSYHKMEMMREVTRDAEAEDEDDDEDDEDLDRPRKIIKIASNLTRTSSKPPSLSSRTAKLSAVTSTLTNPTSTKTTLDPDWIFNSLWDDEKRPSRPSIKREKVSLAAQLEETSFKLLGKKKAISLKDQFRFMES